MYINARCWVWEDITGNKKEKQYHSHHNAIHLEGVLDPGWCYCLRFPRALSYPFVLAGAECLLSCHFAF